MNRNIPTYLFLFGLLSFSATGEVNKWVDANGQVHYSDQAPPPDVNATALGGTAASDVTESDTAESDVPSTKTVAERDAEYKKNKKAKAEQEQKSAQQKEAADAKNKYCDELRSALKPLEAGARLSEYNANGERVFLDDATRQQRIEEARKGISDNCEQE